MRLNERGVSCINCSLSLSEGEGLLRRGRQMGDKCFVFLILCVHSRRQHLLNCNGSLETPFSILTRIVQIGVISALEFSFVSTRSPLDDKTVTWIRFRITLTAVFWSLWWRCSVDALCKGDAIGTCSQALHHSCPWGHVWSAREFMHTLRQWWPKAWEPVWEPYTVQVTHPNLGA